MAKDSFHQAVILMVLSSIGLSLIGLLGKVGLSYMNLEALIFWRYLIMFILCFGLSFSLDWFREGIYLKFRGLHVLRAVLVLATQYCYYYYMESHSLMNAVILMNTAPFFIPLIERIFLKHRVSFSTWVSIAVSFLGVLFILHPGEDFFQLSSIIGLAAGIFQGASQVVFGVNSKEERSDLSILYLSFIALIFSFFPFLFFGKMGSSSAYYESFSLWPVSWILGGVAVASLINQLFRALAYQHATPSRLSPFLYVSVVFGGLWDWLVFHELPTFSSIVGACFVIFGGVLKIYFRLRVVRKKLK